MLTLVLMLLFLLTSITSGLSTDNGESIIEMFSDEVKLKNYKKIDNFHASSSFFTENKGQFSDEVLFKTHVQDITVLLCKNKIVTVLTQEIQKNHINKQCNKLVYRNHKPLTEYQKLDMISIVSELVDANPETVVIGQHQLSHKNNYFIGNDPDQWYTDVPNYQSVIYQDIYTGIELKYHYQEGSLKYDFIVNPGADPSQINIQYKGFENIKLISTGELEINTRFGTIHEKPPVIYQEINNVQYLIQGSYLLNDNIFSFSTAYHFGSDVTCYHQNSSSIIEFIHNFGHNPNILDFESQSSKMVSVFQIRKSFCLF